MVCPFLLRNNKIDRLITLSLESVSPESHTQQYLEARTIIPPLKLSTTNLKMIEPPSPRYFEIIFTIFNLSNIKKKIEINAALFKKAARAFDSS